MKMHYCTAKQLYKMVTAWLASVTLVENKILVCDNMQIKVNFFFKKMCIDNSTSYVMKLTHKMLC